MTDRKLHLDGPAVLLVLICCVVWGVNQVAVKIALTEVQPLTQAALRSLAAALLVLLWARARRLSLFERDGTLAAGLFAGALFGIEFACIFVGAAVHHRVAHGGVRLSRAVRRRARHAIHRARRTARRAADGRPRRRVRRRRLGLCRRLHGRQRDAGAVDR